MVADIHIAYQVLGVPGEWHLYAVTSDDRP